MKKKIQKSDFIFLSNFLSFFVSFYGIKFLQFKLENSRCEQAKVLNE